MAQPQSVIDRFISEIGTLESSFNSNLSKVVDGLSGLSDRELIDAIGQLNLFDDNKQLNIFESPDGGETIYQRKAGSDKRTKIIKLYDK